jgi:DNA replication licensing factor MCM2
MIQRLSISISLKHFCQRLPHLMSRDYAEMPHLDAYSSSQVDDTNYAPLDMRSRLELEATLNRRDAEAARRQGRIPEMFLPGGEGEDSFGEGGLRLASRRAARQLAGATEQGEAAGEAFPHLSLGDALEGDGAGDMLSVEALADAEAAGYSLSELLALDGCRRRVARDYLAFLTTYLDGQGQSVYSSRIRALCAANRGSLEVSYGHLAARCPLVARLVAHCPRATLAILDAATQRAVLDHFPEYGRIRGDVCVRLGDVPARDNLRDLRHIHLETLVRVHGVVTRRSAVLPQLQRVTFGCGRCGATLGPFIQDAGQVEEIAPGRCSSCAARGPFSVVEATTVYRNFQRISLQEAPNDVPPGRLPRTRDVILLGDLIDTVRPGEAVDVSGIFRHNYTASLNARQGFPVFATLIEANWIGKGHASAGTFGILTEEDIQAIRALAADPTVQRRIISAMAPSIFGHEDIKTALALSLFGGQPKRVHGGKMTIRGDINVLLLGDPGTAKSQFLKYVAQIAPRAIYTTGQGASAVGLTAAVRKDPVSREWTLEGGALVLADQVRFVFLKV